VRLDLQTWLALAIGAAVVLLLAAVLRWARARNRSRLARRRGARAVAGEEEAEALLGELGYVVRERQATRSWRLATSDGEIDVELRVDYVVERDGRALVAEVKTGQSAPSLTNAATRRQLLEYRIAYPVDGALLVDVEGGRVVEVEFPPGAAR